MSLGHLRLYNFKADLSVKPKFWVKFSKLKFCDFFSRGSAVLQEGHKMIRAYCSQHSLLVTVGPNSGDDIVIMMSGA